MSAGCAMHPWKQESHDRMIAVGIGVGFGVGGCEKADISSLLL